MLGIFLEHLDLGLPLFSRWLERADLFNQQVHDMVFLVRLQDEIFGPLLGLELRVEERLFHLLVEREHALQPIPKTHRLGTVGFFECLEDGLGFVVLILEQAQNIHAIFLQKSA